jgi:hypothetical protein
VEPRDATDICSFRVEPDTSLPRQRHLVATGARDIPATLRRRNAGGTKKEHVMTRVKSTIAAIVCASMLVPLLPLASAVAAPIGTPAINNSDTGVTLVGRRGWGPGALFGGIVAGALIAAAISEGRADDRDMRRCARDFPHFSYRTGTYINRYGDERVCPYLR